MPVTFDVSVFEMPQARPGHDAFQTDDERLSIDRLQSLMERTGITVIDLPSTVMPLLAPGEVYQPTDRVCWRRGARGNSVNWWTRPAAVQRLRAD